MKLGTGGYCGPLISTEVKALGNGKALAVIKLEIIVQEGGQISKKSALSILNYARHKIASAKAEVKFDWTKEIKNENQHTNDKASA